MNFLNNGSGKKLLLLPVAFLVLNALFFSHATQEIEKTLLKGKYLDAINFVDMLAAAVEATSDRDWRDHEKNIRDSVEFVDRLHQVYAGAYKRIDDELVLFTERYYETSVFEPLDYAPLMDAINSEDYGRIVIGYTPEEQGYRELHIYFRWMPLYSPTGERYLVVVGVSRLSVEPIIARWVSIGKLASMVMTFLLNIWLVIMLTRLGYVYEEREGDKWRGGRR